MDGIDGENPVKIWFPNENLFKCESLSSACARCPSGQGGHPSLCSPWCPYSQALPKARLIPTGRFANSPLLPPAAEAAQNPSMEPTWHNIPFHEAFPVLSWVHLSGSKAQRRPLSPQQSPARMLWEHQALPAFQSVLDATQRILFILMCLLQFHQHTQT